MAARTGHLAVLRELAVQPLGAQLQVIDLAHGRMTPQDVRFVGDRKLVRIEEVQRGAAVASLLGGDSPNGSGSAADNGSELDSDAPSRGRSRGRRGGRGRSRAKQGKEND